MIDTMKTHSKQTALLALFFIVSLSMPSLADTPKPVERWLDVVRQTPYWASKGVATNLATIREWVLFSKSYCQNPERHLLYDHRGQFLAYIENAENPEATTQRLNETRQRMAQESRAQYWSPGDLDSRGYPFALACDQPFADMNEAIARLTGTTEEYRLWGTWDGISVGSKDKQVSLVELFRTVYQHRREQGRFTFSDDVIPTLLGKTIIESGGQKNALSAQAAQGIMQLRPNVLDDCEIPEQYRLHRIVQVDCALRLVEQNHRNLQKPFLEVFENLPEKKRNQLYGLLLTQAYQIGVGRTTELLNDEQLGKAAQYFASNHQNFSAEDIHLGMIYHNMGRRDLGLRTLYYVTDSRLAQQALCASPAMADDPWCVD